MDLGPGWGLTIEVLPSSAEFKREPKPSVVKISNILINKNKCKKVYDDNINILNKEKIQSYNHVTNHVAHPNLGPENLFFFLD